MFNSTPWWLNSGASSVQTELRYGLYSQSNQWRRWQTRTEQLIWCLFVCNLLFWGFPWCIGLSCFGYVVTVVFTTVCNACSLFRLNHWTTQQGQQTKPRSSANNSNKPTNFSITWYLSVQFCCLGLELTTLQTAQSWNLLTNWWLIGPKPVDFNYYWNLNPIQIKDCISCRCFVRSLHHVWF